MTQDQVRTLASEIIGDGGAPNTFFVTTHADVFVVDEYGDGDFERADGYDDGNDYSYTYGPFYSYEEAQKCYDDQDLDIYTGVCTVVMEDRQTGTIKEKFLRKVLTVDYQFDEHDDSKAFGYTN